MGASDKRKNDQGEEHHGRHRSKRSRRSGRNRRRHHEYSNGYAYGRHATPTRDTDEVYGPQSPPLAASTNRFYCPVTPPRPVNERLSCHYAPPLHPIDTENADKVSRIREPPELLPFEQFRQPSTLSITTSYVTRFDPPPVPRLVHFDDFGPMPNGLRNKISPSPSQDAEDCTSRTPTPDEAQETDTVSTNSCSPSIEPEAAQPPSPTEEAIRFFQKLVHWCKFFGLKPPASTSPFCPRYLLNSTRDDPLMPFIIMFREKFFNYNIPKLKVLPSEVMQINQMLRDQSKEFCIDDDDPPTPPSDSSLDDLLFPASESDDEIDLDVLVLQPEIEDILDIEIMIFCGML